MTENTNNQTTEIKEVLLNPALATPAHFDAEGKIVAGAMVSKFNRKAVVEEEINALHHSKKMYNIQRLSMNDNGVTTVIERNAEESFFFSTLEGLERNLGTFVEKGEIMTPQGARSVENFFGSTIEVHFANKAVFAANKLFTEGFVVRDPKNHNITDVIIIQANVAVSAIDGNKYNLLKGIEKTAEENNWERVALFNYGAGGVKDGRGFALIGLDDSTMEYVMTVTSNGINQVFDAKYKGKDIPVKTVIKEIIRANQTVAPSVNLTEGLTVNDIGKGFVAVVRHNSEWTATEVGDGNELIATPFLALAYTNFSLMRGTGLNFNAKDVITSFIQSRLQGSSKASSTPYSQAAINESFRKDVRSGMRVKYVTVAKWNYLRVHPEDMKAVQEQCDAIAISNLFTEEGVDYSESVDVHVISSTDEMKVPWFFGGEKGNEDIHLLVLKNILNSHVESRKVPYQLTNSLLSKESRQRQKDMIRNQVRAEILAVEPNITDDELYLRILEEEKKRPNVVQEIMNNTPKSVVEKTLGVTIEETVDAKGNKQITMIQSTEAPDPNMIDFNYIKGILPKIAPQVANEMDHVIASGNTMTVVSATNTMHVKKSRMEDNSEQAYVIGKPQRTNFFHSTKELTEFMEENRAVEKNQLAHHPLFFNNPASEHYDKEPSARKVLRGKLVAAQSLMKSAYDSTMEKVKAENELLHPAHKLSYIGIREEVYNRLKADVKHTIEFLKVNEEGEIVKEKTAVNIFDYVDAIELEVNPGVLCSGEFYAPIAIQYAKDKGMKAEELFSLIVRYPKPGIYDAPVIRFLGNKKLKSRLEQKRLRALLTEEGKRRVKTTNEAGEEVFMRQADLAHKCTYEFFKNMTTAQITFPLDINWNLIMAGSDWDIDSFMLVLDSRIVESMKFVQSEVHEMGNDVL